MLHHAYTECNNHPTLGHVKMSECQITQSVRLPRPLGTAKLQAKKKINNYCNCMMNTLLVLEDIHYCC